MKMLLIGLSLIAQFAAISAKDLCVDDAQSTCPGTPYACSCLTCYDCNPAGVACNCFNCGCYTRCPELCGATMPECEYSLNTDSSKTGRCGPLYDNVRCNTDQGYWAEYCNEDNGWCGTSTAYRGAQTSDVYDYDPASCQDTSGSDDSDPDYGHFSICVKDQSGGQTSTDTIKARLTVRSSAAEFLTSDWVELGAQFGSSSLGTCIDFDVFEEYNLYCWDHMELSTCSSDGLTIETIKYWDCNTWNYVEVPTFTENPNYPEYSPSLCIVDDYIWLDGDRYSSSGAECFALRIDLDNGRVLMNPPITSGRDCPEYSAKSIGLSLIDDRTDIKIDIDRKVMIFGGILMVLAVISSCYNVYICWYNKHNKGYKSVRVFSDTEQEIVVK